MPLYSVFEFQVGFFCFKQPDPKGRTRYFRLSHGLAQLFRGSIFRIHSARLPTKLHIVLDFSHTFGSELIFKPNLDFVTCLYTHSPLIY